MQQLTCGFGWPDKKKISDTWPFLSSKQNGRFKKWEHRVDGHKMLGINFAGARGSTDGLNKVRPKVVGLPGLVFFYLWSLFIFLIGCLLFISHILLAWSREITKSAFRQVFDSPDLSPFLCLLPCFPVYFSIFSSFFLFPIWCFFRTFVLIFLMEEFFFRALHRMGCWSALVVCCSAVTACACFFFSIAVFVFSHVKMQFLNISNSLFFSHIPSFLCCFEQWVSTSSSSHANEERVRSTHRTKLNVHVVST